MESVADMLLFVCPRMINSGLPTCPPIVRPATLGTVWPRHTPAVWLARQQSVGLGCGEQVAEGCRAAARPQAAVASMQAACLPRFHPRQTCCSNVWEVSIGPCRHSAAGWPVPQPAAWLSATAHRRRRQLLLHVRCRPLPDISHCLEPAVSTCCRRLPEPSRQSRSPGPAGRRRRRRLVQHPPLLS